MPDLRRRFLLTILLAGVPGVLQAQQEPAPVVTVILQEDHAIPPGKHSALLKIGQEEYPCEVSVAVREQVTIPDQDSDPPGTVSSVSLPDGIPDPAPASPSETPINPLLTILITFAATILVGAAVLWYYLKRVRPRRQMQPYYDAIDLIGRKQYEEALSLLVKMEGVLPASMRTDARFYMAFCAHQTRDYNQSRYLLEGLHKKDPKDRKVAYLLAYMLVEQTEDYRGAELVLDEMEKNGHLNYLHTRKLLGMVKFHRAMAAYQEGRVDASAELFDKVSALGDYAEHIPPDLRNRQVFLGTQALFEGDLPRARKEFESLKAAASAGPPGEAKTQLAMAEIGLVLVLWLENDPASHARVEEQLIRAARLLCPEGPLELPWEEKARPQEILERVRKLRQSESTPEEKVTRRCLRDIHLLRAMNVLRQWALLPGEKAHAAMEKYYENCLSRLACSNALDETFPDPMLVAGLLMFYLRQDQADHDKAFQHLQEAQKRGVRVPEALEIVRQADRLRKIGADAVVKYLEVIDRYLHDDTVRKELREALITHLSRYSQFQKWDRKSSVSVTRMVDPSVAELRARAELMSAHIEQILKEEAAKDKTETLKQLAQALIDANKQMAQQAQAVEERESDLLQETGSALFRE